MLHFFLAEFKSQMQLFYQTNSNNETTLKNVFPQMSQIFADKFN